MRILIAGGTGLIGSALTSSLLADGHSVIVLTRHLHAGQARLGVEYLGWDAATPHGWGDRMTTVDAVVNLTGESLSKWPWTKQRKSAFRDSRIQAGTALVDAIRLASPRPKVFIQISGINYYGVLGEQADESTAPGDDFLSRLAVDWEQASQEVENLGVRRCILRLGVVLATKGGLLPVMALPVKLFMGGPIGDGKQAVPWIHLDDVVGAIHFLIDTPQASGAYNGVSPEPISNADFYRALGRAYHRPYWFRTPTFLLRLALGGLSVLVVDGRYSIPKRLIEAGYRFHVSNLQQALVGSSRS